MHLVEPILLLEVPWKLCRVLHDADMLGGQASEVIAQPPTSNIRHDILSLCTPNIVTRPKGKQLLVLFHDIVLLGTQVEAISSETQSPMACSKILPRAALINSSVIISVTALIPKLVIMI